MTQWARQEILHQIMTGSNANIAVWSVVNSQIWSYGQGYSSWPGQRMYTLVWSLVNSLIWSYGEGYWLSWPGQSNVCIIVVWRVINSPVWSYSQGYSSWPGQVDITVWSVVNSPMWSYDPGIHHDQTSQICTLQFGTYLVIWSRVHTHHDQVSLICTLQLG